MEKGESAAAAHLLHPRPLAHRGARRAAACASRRPRARSCSSAIESVLPQSFKKNLQLKTEVSDRVPMVTVDGDKIRQCVVNLLSNSVKFTPAGGTSRCRPGRRSGRPDGGAASAAPGYFQISVSDNGHRHRPGAAAQGLRDVLPGRLVGLARIRRRGPRPLHRASSYVEAHGGEVTVMSELGKGRDLHADPAHRAAGQRPRDARALELASSSSSTLPRPLPDAAPSGVR